MKLEPETQKTIRRVGAVLLIVGAVPIAWLFYNFQAIPNFLRLTAMVPFFFGVPLFTVDDYFDGWGSLAPHQKGRAIAWLFMPFLTCIGALMWYLNDPLAKA